jgi:hypothetical protein
MQAISVGNYGGGYYHSMWHMHHQLSMEWQARQGLIQSVQISHSRKPITGRLELMVRGSISNYL